MAYMKGLIGCIQQYETANEEDPAIWAKTLDGIGNSNVDQTYNLGNKTTHAHGVGLKPDGSILFAGSMTGTFNDYVIEYPLSTNFDLSTASVSDTASDHLDISSYETLIGGIDFADDGSKLFTFGRTTVDRWDLSTAYDLSTGSHVTNTLSVSSQTSMMYDGYVKGDGTRLFVVGYNPDYVYQYDLSTAYDLGTASYTQSFDISAKSIVTSGIHFSSDGYAFVVYDNHGDDAHKYNLSSAWDISTASFHSSSGSFGSTEGTGGGIWFDDDWTYMFLVGEDNDDCHRINLANVPDVPANVSVSTASTSQLNLSWDASSGADSYQISRSTSSGSGYSQIATGITATSYNNTGLSVGDQYFYKIRAVNSEGNSAYSSEANGWTLPGQVTGGSGSAQSNTQINLSWNNPSGTETGYKVERATSSGGSFSQIATPSGTSYNDTGLTLNTTYYYKVRAYNTGGNGAYSSEFNETTQNNASAPTSVSIATSSSGNYNNSVIITSKNTGSSGEDALVSNDGSTASSNTVTVEFNYNTDYNAMVLNNSGELRFHTKAYGRATGGTSYAFDISNSSVTYGSGNPTNVISSSSSTGSPITAQDGTGSSGVGEDATFQHNSGGRGYLLLIPGDYMKWEVDFTATNSGGSTTATTIDVELELS